MSRKPVVLFIDDELITLSKHIELLKERSFELVEVGDSDSAIRQFKEYESSSFAAIDIVVIDMGMEPPKDGFGESGFMYHEETGAHLLASLRTWDRGTRPVVIFSQLNEADIVNPTMRAFESTMQVIGKPKNWKKNRSSSMSILQNQFKTWIVLKAEVGPVDFVDKIESILSIKGIHSPLW